MEYLELEADTNQCWPTREMQGSHLQTRNGNISGHGPHRPGISTPFPPWETIICVWCRHSNHCHNVFLPTVTHFSNFICHFPAFKVMPLQPVELSISAQFPVFDRQSTSEKSHWLAKKRWQYKLCLSDYAGHLTSISHKPRQVHIATMIKSWPRTAPS